MFPTIMDHQPYKEEESGLNQTMLKDTKVADDSNE